MSVITIMIIMLLLEEEREAISVILGEKTSKLRSILNDLGLLFVAGTVFEKF